MSKTELLDAPVKTKLFLMGNDAIARGAIEAGLSFAAAYPGTPSSEIGDALAKVVNEGGFYFEYSTNEKVAMEAAAAAAACGLRAMTFMKHVGLNVAADPFMSTAYIGTEGGFVIVTADDPSLHSSQNEQDNRYYSKLAKLPMLEPSSPREAKEMTLYAFELSEQLKLPVILRTTTRVSHIRGVVEIGEAKKPKQKGVFEKNPAAKVPVPANARIMHLKLLEKMKQAQEISEDSPLNFETGRDDPSGRLYGKKAKLSFITSGPSYNYLCDFLAGAKLSAKILKLGFTNPLPEEKIKKFLSENKKVAVVEELEPFLELQIRSIAQKYGLKCRIYGKLDGYFPVYYEFNEDIIKDGVFKILNKKQKNTALRPEPLNLPQRPPVLCPGCGHRAAYYAAGKALKKANIKNAIFPSDIGCYTLGIAPPFHMTDYVLCMGSSTGTPAGFSAGTDQPIISFIGDSTFFHTGIPGLINSIHNKHRMILVILDNSTTAMTGHQSHPGMRVNAMGQDSPAVNMEKLVASLGVQFVKVVDPYNVNQTIEAFTEALEINGVAVIIARRKCCIIAGKEKTGEIFSVNQEKCKKCGICLNDLACPAMYKKEENIFINKNYCFGCGVCTQICPLGAIEQTGRD